MHQSLGNLVRGGAILLAGVLAVSGALGDEKAPKGLTYVAKADIEVPTERLLAARAGSVTAATERGAVQNPTAATADQPKVPPGRVKWHADFATACRAAQQSGKPVLLFHMMGKLDDQFC
jgi:hypothetical protein